jgi:pimeloyl-ACP methyl ester carboxylesterase
VSGVALRRVELGAGEPAVVLEAGRNDVADSWRPVMALLAPRVRVVAYDRAGLGGSPRDPDPVIVGRQVRDLESIVTGLAAGPCVLAGHSWGGVLVQLLAFRRPDLVAGLVLIDPADERMPDALPRAVRWGTRLARAAARRDELRGGDRAASAELLRELRAADPPFPDVPVEVLSAGRGFPSRFRARWTALQADLAAAAPRGRHLVVDRVGHNLPELRPVVVADAILRVVTEARMGGTPEALSHPARELVHVEIVPPGADLAAADLKGAHDRQLERLGGELEDVDPLRHHDRTIGRDVDDAEVDALDARRAGAQDRSDRVGDVLPACDRRQRDVVVNGVLGEECGQIGCSHVAGPRGAKPAHNLDRAFHLAPSCG